MCCLSVTSLVCLSVAKHDVYDGIYLYHRAYLYYVISITFRVSQRMLVLVYACSRVWLFSCMLFLVYACSRVCLFSCMFVLVYACDKLFRINA